MFKESIDRDNYISEINLQLESFIGRKLIQVKFKESGNSFLLVFSNMRDENSLSAIQFFNCFLFNGDVIPGLCITEAYIKKLGVFAFEYCNRHGINATNFIEFNIIANEERNAESQRIRSVLIGCERIAITENVNNTSHFWEI